MANIPCNDPTPAELREMPGWLQSWSTATDYHGRFSSSTKTCMEGVAQEFMDEGCAAAERYRNVSICNGALLPAETANDLCTMDIDYVPKLARFCPTTCGCNNFQNASKDALAFSST